MIKNLEKFAALSLESLLRMHWPNCLNVSISCSVRIPRKSEIYLWSWQIWYTGTIERAVLTTVKGRWDSLGHWMPLYGLAPLTYLLCLELIAWVLTWRYNFRWTPKSICAPILHWLSTVWYTVLSIQPPSISVFKFTVDFIGKFSWILIKIHRAQDLQVVLPFAEMSCRWRRKLFVFPLGPFLLSCLQHWQLDYVHPKND